MKRNVTILEVIRELHKKPILDVRTPAEFENGHIPGAISFPLFSDEERVIVGTAFKQQSPEKALLAGLDFVGPRMRATVEEAIKLVPEREVYIHCWRGGKRSGSVGWLLSIAGFEVGVIEGGYKTFRRHILNEFGERKTPFIILGGYTGSGKTDILLELKKSGEQILDLEALAHHKGSAFGALGEENQPSVEQFENDLFIEWEKLDTNKRIWLENESQSIGRVFIPSGIWKQKQQAPMVHLEIPFEVRLEHLVKQYADFPVENLISSFQGIAKRLGGQHVKTAMEALQKQDFHTAGRIALRYYDKSYAHSLKRKAAECTLHSLAIDEDNPSKTAKLLKDFVEKHIELPAS